MKNVVRIFFGLMTLCMILVSCKPEEHEHTYSDKWKSNKTEHWHEATCEHSEEVSDRANHEFSVWTVTKESTEDEEGEKVRVCSVCGYEDIDAIAKKEHIPVKRSETTYDEDDGRKIVTDYEDEIKVKEVCYTIDGLIGSVNEYEKKSGNILKTTFYDSEGVVHRIIEYDYINGIQKETSYNCNGVIQGLEEYDIDTCNMLKQISYYSDGSIYYIYEYDGVTGNAIKTKYYNENGTVLLQYKAAEGNYIENLQTYANGSLHINEYNSITEKQVKYTQYETDGTICLEYEASKGNYISLIKHSYSKVQYIEESETATGNRVKTTNYKSDYSIDSVTTY